MKTFVPLPEGWADGCYHGESIRFENGVPVGAQEGIVLSSNRTSVAVKQGRAPREIQVLGGEYRSFE